MFDSTLASFHRSGDHANVAATLAYLAICFEQLRQPEVAATIYGAASRSSTIVWVVDIAEIMGRLTDQLGRDSYDRYVADGATMSLVDAMTYARHHIQVTRSQLHARP